MNCHGVAGGVTADTQWSVKNVAKAGCSVIDMEVGVWRSFILMTVETMDRCLISIGDYHCYCGAGG